MAENNGNPEVVGEKLESRPFCGGEGSLQGVEACWGTCSSCQADGPLVNDGIIVAGSKEEIRKEAIRLWNTRAAT